MRDELEGHVVDDLFMSIREAAADDPVTQMPKASVRHQWRAEASIAELDSTADCYRPAVAGADDLADELRRKSEHVARIAQMQDQREIATKAMKEYDAALAAAAVRRASLLADRVAVWRNFKIAPHSPGEMGSWLSQALEVRRLVDVLGEARANWAECVLAELRLLRSSVLPLRRSDARRRRARCLSRCSPSRRTFSPSSTSLRANGRN